jgi:hypothetical protein
MNFIDKILDKKNIKMNKTIKSAIIIVVLIFIRYNSYSYTYNHNVSNLLNSFENNLFGNYSDTIRYYRNRIFSDDYKYYCKSEDYVPTKDEVINFLGISPDCNENHETFQYYIDIVSRRFCNIKLFSIERKDSVIIKKLSDPGIYFKENNLVIIDVNYEVFNRDIYNKKITIINLNNFYVKEILTNSLWEIGEINGTSLLLTNIYNKERLKDDYFILTNDTITKIDFNEIKIEKEKKLIRNFFKEGSRPKICVKTSGDQIKRNS